MTTSQTPSLLFCLGGQPPPADLAPSLASCAELPDEAIAKLPKLVAACLEPLPESALLERIAQTCASHEIDPDQVLSTVLGARFMLHACAEVNATAEQLAKDLDTLGASPVADWLVPLFRETVKVLRTDIARAAITAHGRVLTGIEWRIDSVTTSNRGRELNVPVALVTMHYVDGGDEGRVTLQMLPDMINELRQVCDQLLT